MFKSLKFGRQNDRLTIPRPRLCRRPLVEDLEGRQLQSGIIGQHIGSAVAAIQGGHIGSGVVADGIQGQHIGMTAGIVGAHVGTLA